MEHRNLLIKIAPKLHRELKLEAIKVGLTLQQLCINLLNSGLVSEQQDVLLISGNEDAEKFCTVARALWEDQGLIAVLHAPKDAGDLGVEYILIFTPGAEIPTGVQPQFENSTVMALQLPDTENPPSVLWIQIAKKYEMIWGSTSVQKLKCWASLTWF